MKVLNLQCDAQHDFEGWFASENDFQQQLAQHLVACPLCGSESVQKLPSAPRLNLSHTKMRSSDAPNHAAASADQVPMAAGMPQLQAQVLKAVRELIAHTEDVGSQFASEARKMHYGETANRSIRGHATMDEAAQLLEEGIEVLPLSLPESLKSTLQ